MAQLTSGQVCRDVTMNVFCCQFSIVIDQFEIFAAEKHSQQGTKNGAHDCCIAAQFGNLGTVNQK